MPTLDHIRCFRLSVLLHSLGLILLCLSASKLFPPPDEATDTTDELELVELSLTTDGNDNSAPAGAGKNDAPQSATATSEQPEMSPPPPLEVPRAPDPIPQPILPDKPSFSAELPPPEPVPEPAAIPVPAPAPKPTPAPTPAPVPQSTPVVNTSKNPATAQSAGNANQQATIQSSGGGGGSYSRVDVHPSLERAIKPNYPISARRKGEEGTVILDVMVSADGHANSVTLVTSCGFPELDSAAEKAASQARFKPGTRNGQAVDSAARLTIIFRLRD